MKNFPNQASDFARLRATLETIAELKRQGRDVSDDGLLGYELARRRHYTFRNFNYSAQDVERLLDVRIQQEQQKRGSNQGARTNAREMRRTLVALNWLDSEFNLTEEGERLLKTAPGSLLERQLLGEALLQLEVSDSQGISHPVRLMLDLLAVAPSLHRDGLELVLEARDDSPQELTRILDLYQMPKADRYEALHALGVTQTQINNAVKIFPTLARTAGLVVEDEAGTFSLSPEGLPITQTPDKTRRPASGSTPRPRATYRRSVTAETVAGRASGVPSTGLSLADQERARALLAERTDRHQQLVRSTARLITSPGSLYESPVAYDLLWVPNDTSLPLVLFEMKTLNRDARSQARLAVAQLSWYHFFDVSPEWEERGVIEVAVFDGHPGDDSCRYLAHEGVVALLLERNGKWHRLSSLEPGLPDLLGFPEDET